MGRHRPRAIAIILVALSATALVLISLLGSAPTAGAQLSCEVSATRQVSTADEFNAAIGCHNDAGTVTNIVLLNDIDAATLVGGSVFATIGGFNDLIIEGNGNSLRRGPTAAETLMPLIAVGDGEGKVQFVEANIELGEFETFGIEHTGSKTVQLIASSIQPGPNGTAGTGIRTASPNGNGQFLMEQSLIQFMPVGMRIESPVYVIETSTILSTVTDIELATTGFGGLFQSTLGGPVGIELTAGGIRVEHSTILGDGAAVSPTAGPDSHVTFLSSLVSSCTADEFLTDTQPGPGWADLDYNAGRCFGDSTSGTSSPVDNGCTMPTPAGCPYTSAISTFSPAHNAGRCDTGTYDGVERDQRGQLRTPFGEGCDSGAYEYGCNSEYAEFDVYTELDFAAAIECANMPAAVEADDVRWVFADVKADIAASAVHGSSVFPSIDADIRGEGDLFFWIYGDEGYTVSRGPDAPPTSADLFSITGSDQLSVRFMALGIVVGPNDLSAVRHNGPGELRFEASSITAAPSGTSATGVVSESSPAGTIVFNGAKLDGLPVGISTGTGGFNLINLSSFNASDTALALDDGTSEIINSTLVAPTAVKLYGPGSVHATNSTVVGDGAAIVEPEFGGTIAYRSSIVTECSSAIIDNGNNIGDCFAPGATVDTTLADNGCEFQIALLGCTHTVALSPTASAIGQGDCTDFPASRPGFPDHVIDIDQRYAQRTPHGVGCDAGAFEAPEPALPGDVTDDGIVDNNDVQAILEWLAGGAEPPQLALGDLTGDGLVKLDDALALAQLVAAN